MADYSKFEFHLFSIEEIVQMAIDSEACGDDEFVVVCLEELKKRKIHHDPHPQDTDSNSLHRLQGS